MLYRTVKTDIWSDPWFETLHPGAKCLFLYLFTNDRVSACGAMEVSLARIASDTKIPAKKIAADLEAFGNKILWLPEHNLIIVRNFYKHQRSQSSENFTKAAKKAMADLPGEARAWVGGVYPELLDTPTHPIPNPSPSLGDKETATATATALTTAKATASAAPSNGRADAAAAESYCSVIGETTCTKVAEQFRRIDASLVPGWFGGMLRTAQSQCGPAHRPQLEEAVKVTLSEVERRLSAEKNGGGMPIVSVKKFTEHLFMKNLSDALGVAR